MSLAEAQRRYPELRAAERRQRAGVRRRDGALPDADGRATSPPSRELAADFDAIHVPTQAAFDEAIRHQPPMFWAADRVHPGAPGHAVIARAFLRAVGYGDV